VNRILSLALAGALAGAAAMAPAPSDAEMRHHKRMMHGRQGAFIGVKTQSMTSELRQHLKAPSERGVLVARVIEDSPAAKAGLKVGDIILSAGGEDIEHPYDLAYQVRRADEGESLPLRLVRGGRTRSLKVTPERRDGEHMGRRGKGRREMRKEVMERFDAIEKRLDALEKR